MLASLVIAGSRSLRYVPSLALLLAIPLLCVLQPQAMGTIRGLTWASRTTSGRSLFIAGWIVLVAILILTLIGFPPLAKP